MQENQTIKVMNESGELLEKAIIHNSDLSDRQGYDEDFLGIKLSLPIATRTIQNEIAVNSQPNRNSERWLDYQHFSVLFNKIKRLPFVTAVNIEGATNELALIHEERDSDKWYQDQRIKTGDDFYQFDNEDYRHSHFEKGHMVRYYDPAWGDSQEIKQIAMGDTFYYTNCCPQLHGLNVGYWGKLENYSMARAIFQDKKMSVFSGPIFNKAQQIGKLLVPVNFWKILVYRKEDKLEAIGFIVSQELAFNKLFQEEFILERMVQPTLKEEDINRLFNEENLKKYQVKISLIEEKTGLEFGLNDIDVNKNETQYFGKLDVPETALKKEIKEMKHLMGIQTDNINVDTFLRNL